MGAIVVLNAEPGRRLNGPDRVASDLIEAALELPDPQAEDRLKKSAAALHELDPAKIAGEDTRTAFWINVYNALRRFVFHVNRPRTSVPLSLGHYRRMGWRIGGHDYTLSIIHHGLLRKNRRPLWTPGRLLGDGDPRLEAAPSTFDPRIHFALSTGAEDSLPARRFLSGMLDKQLRQAEQEYLVRFSELDRRSKVLAVPPLLRAYRHDFQLRTRDEAADWVIERMPEQTRRWLLENRAELTLPWRLLALRWTFPASRH